MDQVEARLGYEILNFTLQLWGTDAERVLISGAAVNAQPWKPKKMFSSTFS